MTGKRERRAPIWGPAFVLAFGVVGWEQLYHRALGISESIPWSTHLAVDGSLALPAALVAVLIGRRFRWRALLSAAIFTLLLVPSVGIHQLIHARTVPFHPGHALAVRDGGNLFAHGLLDAAIAAPIALSLSVLTIGARRRLRVRRTPVLLAACLVFGLLPGVQPAPAAVTPFTSPLPIPQVLTGSDITLTAASTPVQILPGQATNMWTFNGTFPGPTIRRTSGQQTRVTVVNNLPSSAGEITIHQHGEHAASTEDGQPSDQLIPAGGSRTYTYDFFENGAPERGAFQWYHDHRMDVTGRNIWMGLAGMVILDDPAEAAINAALPNGARDVPLMVVDRTLDSSNQIPYTFKGDGDQGDQILVNGAAQPYFDVADVKYRFRILNASNARSYDFALSDGRPMVQVATESGLLPVPVSRSHILLGPAERAEVIVDFSGELNRDVVLQNSGGFGPGLSQVMQFRVRRDEPDTSTVPSTLRTSPTFGDPLIVTTRPWIFGRDLTTGEWTINGNGFDHNRVDAQPKLGTAERWVFINTTDVDHIVHIHDVDWRISSRISLQPLDTASLLGEAGLRESFRIRPNEIVIVVSQFTDHTGKFVLHCHILEHEDFSMMTQFEVVP